MVAPWVPYKGSELPESQGQFYMKRFGFCRVLGYQEKPSKAQENVSLLKVAWDSLRKFPQLTKASASWEQESILEVSHLLLFLTSPTGSAVPPALSHQSITLHPSCSSFTRAQPINGLSSSFLFFSFLFFSFLFFSFQSIVHARHMVSHIELYFQPHFHSILKLSI